MKHRILPGHSHALRRGLVITCAIVALGLVTGCSPPKPTSVKIDAPMLAFALMFVGFCAVCCSSIGGFCLVRATKNRRGE
jgi:hypothetical protein